MGKQVIKRILSEATEFKGDKVERIPFSPEMIETLPFPMHILPEILQKGVSAVQDRTQAPLDLCVQSILAAASLAVQGHANIETIDGNHRPISNFFITVAESSERKTSCDGLALEPVFRYEREQYEKYKVKYNDYQNQKDAYDFARKKAIGRLKSVSDIEQSLRALGDPPTPPAEPYMLCPEPTIEGLTRQMSLGQPSMGIFSSEGGQFFGGYSMSDTHRQKTISALSTMWDGAPVKSTRKGDGSLFLPGRRLCINLMLQPEIWRGLVCDPLLNGQGFFSRFLLSVPVSNIGTRFQKPLKPDTTRNLDAYHTHLSLLLEYPLPIENGNLKPRLLSLDKSAYTKLLKFADHIEKEIAPDGAFECIRPFAGKCVEHALRLSAVFTLVQDIHATTINEKCFSDVTELVEYYAAQWLSTQTSAKLGHDYALAEKVWSFLNRWEEPLISAPDLYQRGPNQIRGQKQKTDQIIKLLLEHNYLLPHAGKAKIKGVVRQAVFWINHDG